MTRSWVGLVAVGLLAGPAVAEGRGPRSSPAKVEGMKNIHEGSLKVGDPAPDVALVGLDGVATTLLAARRPDRPLVVIFGSFT